MKEDTHYLSYHCAIESGYTPSIESISHQRNENGKNEVRCRDFTHTTLINFHKFCVGSNAPEPASYGSQYLVSYEVEKGSNYLQSFTIPFERMLNEEPLKTLLSATWNLKGTKERHNIDDSKTYINIIDTIEFALQQLYIAIGSYQNTIHETLLQTILDMLTLVIFIFLLRRYFSRRYFSRR